MPLLEVRGLVKRFLGVTAVDAVDLAVERGELVSLIGPNGSGKTTLFNCVTGYLPSDGGRVLFRGRDLTGAPPHRVARLGLGRTFQLVSVFPRLSALENLLVFLQQHQEEQLLARLLRTPRVRRLEAVAVERARRLLDAGRPGRARRRRCRRQPLLRPAQAARLRRGADARPRADPARRAGGRREPDDDQPDEGPHPACCTAQGKTILLVEHNMDVVMDISQRIVVLDHGQKIAEGPPDGDPPPPARSSRRTLAADRRAARALRDVRAGYAEVDVLRGVRCACSPDTSCPSSAPTAPASRRCSARCSAWCGRRRAASVFSGEDITGARPIEVLAPRRRLCAAGALQLPGDERAREPRDGRLPA